MRATLRDTETGRLACAVVCRPKPRRPASSQDAPTARSSASIVIRLLLAARWIGFDDHQSVAAPRMPIARLRRRSLGRPPHRAPRGAVGTDACSRARSGRAHPEDRTSARIAHRPPISVHLRLTFLDVRGRLGEPQRADDGGAILDTVLREPLFDVALASGAVQNAKSVAQMRWVPPRRRNRSLLAQTEGRRRALNPGSTHRCVSSSRAQPARSRSSPHHHRRCRTADARMGRRRQRRMRREARAPYAGSIVVAQEEVARHRQAAVASGPLTRPRPQRDEQPGQGAHPVRARRQRCEHRVRSRAV